MKIEAAELISDLQNATKKVIRNATDFKNLNPEFLNKRVNNDSWSILECLEHLNLYGDFYLKEIENRILKAPHVTSSVFKSGLLGNYFALMMLPKNGRLKKMKTFKDKDPIRSKLDIKTIDRFLKQQEKTLELLERARNVDLAKTKTAISISRFIKLKLGDTFRVVIYHNQRHILQAQNVLKQLK